MKVRHKNMSSQNNSFNNTQDVLSYIKNEYSTDIFLNTNKLIGLFSDIAPLLYKEKKLVAIALKEGVDRKSVV